MLHNYSTDSAERRIIPFFIATAAIVAAYATPHFLSWLGVTAPWWLSPLDTMGYYGLFYSLFNNRLWKTSFCRRLGITRIPDLSGRWQGCALSSHDGVDQVGTGKELELTITQTWRDILILSDTDTSSSHSVSASLLVAGVCSLSYEYINEPNACAAETMHGHRGTARLLIKQEGNRLDGDYYSGRDRMNIGRIELKKMS